VESGGLWKREGRPPQPGCASGARLAGAARLAPRDGVAPRDVAWRRILRGLRRKEAMEEDTEDRRRRGTRGCAPCPSVRREKGKEGKQTVESGFPESCHTTAECWRDEIFRVSHKTRQT